MRVRTKHFMANGFSLELTVGLDEARQRLDLTCQIYCRKVMHVKDHNISRTPYVQKPLKVDGITCLNFTSGLKQVLR